MGDVIEFDNFKAKILEKLDYGEIRIMFDCNNEELIERISKVGRMPLPPYIKRSKEEKNLDRINYQTIFANKIGAVAAPTAGLHFTESIINKIKGGNIPTEYIPGVQKGLLAQQQIGVMAGFPCIDFKVTLYDGNYHDVDSSVLAFEIASRAAFREGIAKADPKLLEPMMKVEVVTPEEYMGDIMGDISGKRGKIMGMESDGTFQIIKAQVPQAELYHYATTVRSLTGGRGIHSESFSHYEKMPKEYENKVIQERKKQEDE